MVEDLPDRATRMNQSGRATIRCGVTTSGTLTDCSVVSEDPPDFGFGAMALKESRRFRMKPKTVDGVAVTGTTIIPMRMVIPTE